MNSVIDKWWWYWGWAAAFLGLAAYDFHKGDGLHIALGVVNIAIAALEIGAWAYFRRKRKRETTDVLDAAGYTSEEVDQLISDWDKGGEGDSGRPAS